MSLTGDGHPLVGPTGLAGLLIATGTYRNGVLLAPAIAAVITAELSGQQQGLFSSFASDAGFRTGVASMAEQIIGQGAKHLTSMLLEPGGHLPYERQRELEAFVRALLAMTLVE